LIIYLNDDFEGGETEFPELKLKIKPVKGKGILFHNTDDNQVIHKKSIHKGNEVLGGGYVTSGFILESGFNFSSSPPSWRHRALCWGSYSLAHGRHS
jgi:hypothetical protein